MHALRTSRETRLRLACALVLQLCAHAWHAVRLVGGLVHLADLPGQNRIRNHTRTGSSALAAVVPAGRATQCAAHRAHVQRVGGVGLVRAHEFVDGVDVFSLLPTNQAVAFAGMSRSCSTWRSLRQTHQLFALGCGQTFFAGQRLPAIACVLGDSVGNALRRRAKLRREFGRRAAKPCQLDDLLTKLRRIWRLGFGHVGPPPCETVSCP